MLLSMGISWLGWAMTWGSILETLGSFGSLLGRLWVACGLQWVRQGAPMSYLALLCRREHQSEGPGGPKGSMWGLKVCRAEMPCGPLWPGIEPGLGRGVAPIEEQLIRFCTIQPGLLQARVILGWAAGLLEAWVVLGCLG